MRDGIGRARLDAIAAEDATRIIDVVNARVPLTGGDTLCVGVFRSLDVDAARRASRRTQKAAHALFQPVFVPMQNVNHSIPTMEVDRPFGLILRDGFAQDVVRWYGECT